MKLLVCLASLLVISTVQGQDSTIDMVGDLMESELTKLKSDLFEHVVEQDGSAFKPLVEALFGFMEPQFCPEDSAAQCDARTSWLFGCKCRRAFAALGECGATPCEAFRWIKDNGPEALSSFANADSYEERMEVLVDYLVNPLSRLICECRGVVGASIKCVKDYNRQIFERFQLDSSELENLVDNLDWKVVQGFLEGFLEVGCGEYKGDDCVVQFGQLYVALGTLMDNTFSGQDTCLSVIRAEAEYTAYVMSFLGDTDDIQAFLHGVADAYVNMERKLMCDVNCAGEIQQNFYNSCCLKRAAERFVTGDMRKKYGKLVKSIASLFIVDKPIPKLRGVLNKMFSVYDPETFCGAGVGAYRELNEQCDAIEV